MMKMSPRSRSRSPVRSRSPRRGGGFRERDRSPLHRRGVSDRMVYLSNLPFETTWMELKDLIREKVGEVNFVEVLQDRGGKSKGCAVVDFKTKDEASKCIDSLHRMEIRARLIVAKEIRDPVAFFRKVKDDTGIDFLGRGDRSGRPVHEGPAKINENETYGLSYNCGVGRLFDIFALAGRITWIDLQLDKEGKTKGICVVEYSHPIEAVQAISMMHNQRIFDRTISVKMDKFPREGENRRDGDLPVSNLAKFGLHSVGMGLGANGAPLTDVAGVISSLSSTPTSFPQHQNGSGIQAAPIPPLANAGSYSATNYVSPQQPTQAYQTGSTYAKLELQDGSAMYGSGSAMGAGGYSTQTPAAPVPAPMTATPAAQGGYFGSTPQYQTNQQSRSVPFTGGVMAPPQSQHWRNSSRVILIKNLPGDYTWQIVSDRVQQFGDLESVEMVSPGVAKIRFLQLKDAERAMNTLHGTKVEDRTILTEYL